MKHKGTIVYRYILLSLAALSLLSTLCVQNAVIFLPDNHDTISIKYEAQQDDNGIKEMIDDEIEESLDSTKNNVTSTNDRRSEWSNIKNNILTTIVGNNSTTLYHKFAYAFLIAG